MSINFKEKHLMKKLILLLVAGAMLVGCQGQSSGGNAKTPDQIKAQLTKEIPGLTKIDAVEKSPVNGMYEVIVGRKVFYVTTDGKYLLFGNLIDPVTKKSLTEERTQELSKIDFSKLPLDMAIKQVNGNGKRVLVVFSDPDCPYCQMFEKQIVPQLTDTTIYTFLFPLPQHPNARSDSEKVWCSKDRAKTWAAWMQNKTPLPSNVSCDKSALDKVYKLGTDVVQVEGTPTLILANGQILPGILPADQLMAQMDTAAGIKPTASAAK